VEDDKVFDMKYQFSLLRLILNIFLTFFILIGFITNAGAVSFNFNFIGTDFLNMKLNGYVATRTLSLQYYNNRYVLRLTDDYNQASSAYYKNRITGQGLITLREDLAFSTSFSFQLTNPGGISDSDGVGGDGIVFIIQAQSLSALGDAGGKLAYNGITPSIAIEFDTYDNTVDGGDDRNNNGNHISINLNGVLSPVAQYNVPTRMNNGAIWYAWIDYIIYPINSLQISISQDSIKPDKPQIIYPVNLSQILGTNQVYVGFTASTGNGKQTQDIISWQFTSSVVRMAPRLPLLLEE
jgi:hypothetical protein